MNYNKIINYLEVKLMRLFKNFRRKARPSIHENQNAPVSEPSILEVPNNFNWQLFDDYFSENNQLIKLYLKYNVANMFAFPLAENIFNFSKPTSVKTTNRFEPSRQGVYPILLVGADFQRELEVRLQHNLSNLAERTQGVVLYVVMNKEDFAIQEDYCKDAKVIFLFMDMNETEVEDLLENLSKEREKNNLKSTNYSYHCLNSNNFDSYNLEIIVHSAILLLGNATINDLEQRLVKSSRNMPGG